ncbi:hypothetical protein MNBD_GAMMA03-1159 [hydrothermal vent metagenome]|uniref:Flagellar protein n=1 Tax=hydrothermal vent metagenome TaxID=652676 RepID=A0A3B0W2L5_9ZZZZ
MLKHAFIWGISSTICYTSITLAETATETTVAIGESVTRPSEYFGQIMLSLILVLLIIFLAAWILRRYSRFPGVADGNLKVIGALSVGQRERIILLQVGQEQILVGVTSNKITTLHQLEEPIQVKDSIPISSQFSKRLQEALKPTSTSKDVSKDVSKTHRADL